MNLNETLDEIIEKEVYKGVKVEAKLPYDRSELTEEIVERLHKKGYKDLEVIDIDPSSNCVVVRYTGYFVGCKQYPEIHLKTLLILHEEMGADIRDPDIFDEIVEEAKQDLRGKNKKEMEERLYHFAALFKDAF